LFQQNNACPHTENIQTLPWPAFSPDMCLTEHSVSDCLDRHILLEVILLEAVLILFLLSLRSR
uniref:Uncharacterized protein n=1 Tax=Amphilophus citrinellus TaxID=61819 RepID=A0A3Q0T3L4_AMPCI